ncbi:hypothetical protein B0H13DRAFT_2324632 [Mycena leptocephala]|nr:hypothetical protein B0H13DRAFT_2324632 [Mycena leptocephala]
MVASTSGPSLCASRSPTQPRARQPQSSGGALPGVSIRHNGSRPFTPSSSRHQGADLAGCGLTPHLLCKDAVPPLASTTEGLMPFDRGQQRRAANRDGHCPPDETVFDTSESYADFRVHPSSLSSTPPLVHPHHITPQLPPFLISYKSRSAERAAIPSPLSLDMIVLDDPSGLDILARRNLFNAPRLEASRVPLAACSLPVSRGIHALRSFPGIHSPHSFVLGDRRLPALGRRGGDQCADHVSWGDVVRASPSLPSWQHQPTVFPLCLGAAGGPGVRQPQEGEGKTGARGLSSSSSRAEVVVYSLSFLWPGSVQT